MHLDNSLTVGTLATAVVGLVAEALPPTPANVSWPFVALSAIGCLTLAVRLLYAYAMARLQAERHQGENTALKAQVATMTQLARKDP